MPTNARKRHRVGTGGPWGTGLLVLGLACLAQGFGYMTANPDRIPAALRVLGGGLVPIESWAMLWVLSGCYAIYKALRPPQRHIDVWPIVSVTSLWSVAYLMQWATLAYVGIFTRDWSTGVAWGSLASLIICWGRCVNPPVRQR